MSVDGFERSRQAPSGPPLHRFRCVGCSYGASRAAAPERCPMCGGSAWEFEDWSPFSDLLGDLAPKTGHAGGSAIAGASKEPT
jgi:hypothetical protein